MYIIHPKTGWLDNLFHRISIWLFEDEDTFMCPHFYCPYNYCQRCWIYGGGECSYRQAETEKRRCI